MRCGENRSLDRSVTQLSNQSVVCRANSPLGFTSTVSGEPQWTWRMCVLQFSILQLSGEKPSFFLYSLWPPPLHCLLHHQPAWQHMGQSWDYWAWESYLSGSTVPRRAACIVDTIQGEWVSEKRVLTGMMDGPRKEVWSEQNPVSYLSKSPLMASLSILTQKLYENITWL